MKEIKFQFLPNSNYFDIDALYKRSYYRSIENVKGGSTSLLFNGFIVHIIFVEFTKVASFQKDLIFISAKLSVITLTLQIHYN